MKKSYVFGALFWSVIGILTLILWLWGINMPHVGIYNANNNYLSLASENFLRFGYHRLHYLPTYFVGATLPDPVPYYLHHPVLFFLIASVPFALFGNGNWVVHVMTFVYAVSAMVVLYAVIREVSDARVARWSLFFASLFPMASFFWKYMFFEQISLYFTLTSLYFAIRYGKTERPLYLLGLGISAAMGGASDWYAAYLLFGFCYLWLRRRDERMRRIILVYIAGLAVGFGTYAIAIIGTNNIGMIYDGFRARGVTPELTGLSWWPARLLLVTVVRLIIYFSPVAAVGIWEAARVKAEKSSAGIGKRELSILFFIIGIINILVLPTATWGHSYFLYYMIPFVSFGMGLWMVTLPRYSTLVACCMIFLHVGWSIGVNSQKLRQVTKQSWKYEFGQLVSTMVPRYSRIGVMEYPGDVLERYFAIATTVMSASQVKQWAAGNGQTDIPMVIMTCAGECTAGEKEFAASLGTERTVTEYTNGMNTGWIIGGEPAARVSGAPKGAGPAEGNATPSVKPSLLLRFYRALRDALGSTQI